MLHLLCHDRESAAEDDSYGSEVPVGGAMFRELFGRTRSLFLCGELNRRMSGSARLLVAPVIAALIFAACSTSDGGNTLSTADGATGQPAQSANGPVENLVAYDDSGAVVIATEQSASAPRDESLASGLRTFDDPTDELAEPSINLSILRSGGPPPDGIPSIDAPEFHSASTVDYIGATDPVVALEINGDSRAYPLDILIWHELVNDTVGGVPVSVAYCPLCNSVTVYDREIEGQVLDFGVSGLLFNSSLVMYDRQTETLWSHFTGEPLYGALSAAELVSRPATIVGFGTWQDANPDGLVLNRNTGSSRNYGANPYPGYDDVDSDPFLFEGAIDGRYTAMTRVVGVESDDSTLAAAFPLLELREQGVVASSLGGQDIVAFWVPGASSALDGFEVSGGVDVGATGVFSPFVDGQSLTFSSTINASSGAAAITDAETGSTWNIFGEATDGELVGTKLDQLIHIDTFWFAWIAFHPDSAVA